MSKENHEPLRPTDAELEILTVLWSRGASTVREVHEAILERKPTQYTTVLKMLQIMLEKKLVIRDDSERAHRFVPSQPQEWTQQQLAGDLLQRAFAGSASSLMLGALSAKKASKEELAAMKKLIEEMEGGAK
ncbi:MAG: BlaI/MecI/CopY family transcriptional regulator [Acidobacteria bacterium]|nr:BlaI/MecI/CopY family transcriptional regulator [Acidobacteriota bacterium]